jgi:hypothetical protein
MRSYCLILVLAALTRGLGAQEGAYRPREELPSRPQIVAIYFGQTECVPCLRSELKAALHQMKPLLLQQATSANRDFASIGVALDWDLRAGLKLLEPLDELDEVSVGANWLNGQAIRHMWQDSTAQPALPQVIILERTVGEGSSAIAVGPERLLKRLVGAGAIEAWVARGAPLAIPD